MTRPQRVLVLDDDQVMRDLLEALLSLQGYEPMLASSSEEALALLRSGSPVDVVLTDLNMPGLEGRFLGEALRAEMPPTALLLAMSGTEPDEPTRAIFDDFLVKPFEMAALEQTMQTATAKRAQAGEAAGTDPGQTASGTKVLDDAIFDSLVKVIGAPKLGELYAMTVSDIGKRHERILAAAAADDLHTAQREAHAVKGTCGMVGATELQALAAAIEDGTTFNTQAIAEIPAACVRLQRMLDGKLQSI